LATPAVIFFYFELQNMTAGVANISDANTAVSLDGMVSCCNLQREVN
jgi:hypothetical protein